MGGTMGGTMGVIAMLLIAMLPAMLVVMVANGEMIMMMMTASDGAIYLHVI